MPPFTINHARELKIPRLRLEKSFGIFEARPYRKRLKLPALFSFAWEDRLDGF